MPKNESSPVLNIRDTDGSLRKQAAEISKWMNGTIDYSGGIRAAAGFMVKYIRNVRKPINYATAPLDTLRDYTVHGYDFVIRRAALEEIERRLSAPLERIIDLIEKSEPLSVHPVTKEPIGRRPRAQQIIDIASAAIKEIEAKK